jgi:serine phosphatase RsbU (regulator of sigma subunit)
MDLYRIFKILLLLIIVFNGQSVFSMSNDELRDKQGEYIFKAGNKTKARPNSSTKYKVAIVGNNRKTKKLIEYINEELPTKKIRSRQVLFTSYKDFSETGNEDLIVFSSGTKLKTNELGPKLLSVNYIILKESEPFGVNFFNADNLLLKASQLKLEEENVAKEELLKDASNVISVQKDSIVIKNKALDKSAETIETQTSEIAEKLKVIDLQKTIIYVGIFSFVIISALLVLLYFLNKKRKLNLVELKDKSKHITDSLNYAKNIQNAILPDAKFFSSAFKDHFVFFEPKEIVSGDFYWAEEHEGKMYFAVADCTGHGVPGAFLSLVCSRVLSKVIKEKNIVEPCKILDAVSLELEVFLSKNEKKINDGMDVSLICLDEVKKEIIFSGAHNGLIYVKDGEMSTIAGDKQPVGAYDYKKAFTQKVISKDAADTVYLFSDGFPDQFGGPKDKKFSKRRFKDLLFTIEQLSMSEQHLRVKHEFLKWRGNAEQIDDVTVVGFKI